MFTSMFTQKSIQSKKPILKIKIYTTIQISIQLKCKHLK